MKLANATALLNTHIRQLLYELTKMLDIFYSAQKQDTRSYIAQ